MERIIDLILDQGGLGYALFLGAVGVIGIQYKNAREDAKTYADDLKEVTVTFTATAKDLLNGNANLQKSVDALTSIINKRG